MTLIIALLVAALAAWMLACGYQGYRARFAGFFGVLAIGVGVNMVWMAVHFNAPPLDPNALIAQGALTLYGLCAFGFGWLAGRLVRQFRASRVDEQAI